MQFIEKTTKEYPLTYSELVRRFPGLSWPNDPACAALEAANVEPVNYSSQPIYDPATQKLVELQPVKTDGHYQQQWSVVQLAGDELAAAQAVVRAARKVQRKVMLDAITVTVGDKVFDGDELSQDRMTRAIVGMQISGIQSIVWTLANNELVQVTLQEISSALILSGQRQTEIWAVA